MAPEPHYFPVRVYYEDTDHSGLVYHANYLKFFERAREHWLGIDLLLTLARDEGLGFVVYRAEVTYREGARFGDELTVRTTGSCESDYRLVLSQDILRSPTGTATGTATATATATATGTGTATATGAATGKVMVAGRITLACVDRDSRLAPLPEVVRARLPSAS